MAEEKIKRHPKSKGYKATHTCGHEAKHRVSLVWFADSELSSITEEKIASIVDRAKADQETGICPECSATENHEEHRKQLQELSAGLGLPIPEELTGTIRQKAWGESTRTDALRNLIENILVNVRLNTVCFNIINAVFSQKADTELADEVAKQVKSLRQACLQMSHLYYVETQDVEILATLIAARHYMKISHLDNYPVSASKWMMWSKYRKVGLSRIGYGMNPETITAALMVASLGNFSSISEADRLMQFLLERTDASEQDTFNHYFKVEPTINEALEAVQVARVLSPPKPAFDTPPF